MEKIILIGLSVLFLAACGNEDEVVKKETSIPVEQEKKDEPTQEELNSKLKDEAVKADFVELNVESPPNGKKVFVEGVIDTVFEDKVIGKFTMSAEEGDGYGMYSIKMFNTTDAEYTEGDTVRIYGRVDWKDSTGMPQITATILEQK